MCNWFVKLGTIRSHRRHFLCVLIFGLLHAGLAGAWPFAGMVAPDFTLNRTDEGTESLSNYQGSVVYLNFFGATCPICISDGPLSEQIYQTFAGNPEVVTLGIDVWNLPRTYVNTTFRANSGISYTLLYNGRTTGYAYDMENGGSSSTDNEGRGHLVVDQQGIIRYYANYESFGPDERDAVICTIRDLLGMGIEPPARAMLLRQGEGFKLCWDRVFCATRYFVMRSIAGDFSDEEIIAVTVDNAHVIPVIDPEFAIFQVVAVQGTE